VILVFLPRSQCHECPFTPSADILRPSPDQTLHEVFWQTHHLSPCPNAPVPKEAAKRSGPPHSAPVLEAAVEHFAAGSQPRLPHFFFFPRETITILSGDYSTRTSPLSIVTWSAHSLFAVIIPLSFSFPSITSLIFPCARLLFFHPRRETTPRPRSSLSFLAQPRAAALTHIQSLLFFASARCRPPFPFHSKLTPPSDRTKTGLSPLALGK
jgi:hypothetical protein